MAQPYVANHLRRPVRQRWWPVRKVPPVNRGYPCRSGILVLLLRERLVQSFGSSSRLVLSILYVCYALFLFVYLPKITTNSARQKEQFSTAFECILLRRGSARPGRSNARTWRGSPILGAPTAGRTLLRPGTGAFRRDPQFGGACNGLIVGQKRTGE